MAAVPLACDFSILRARRFASNKAGFGLRTPQSALGAVAVVDVDADVDVDDAAEDVGVNLDLTIARVCILACCAPRLVTIGELIIIFC